MTGKWVRPIAAAAVLVAALCAADPALAQADDAPGTGGDGAGTVTVSMPDLGTREGVSSSLQILLLLTILTLAPAILVLATSFTRIIVVLGFLRQAMATQQLPPNQVLIGLALLMTFMVMAPVWEEVNSEALQPYLDGEIGQADALDRAVGSMRTFMAGQIAVAGNQDDVRMFLDYTGHAEAETWGDVPTTALMPAFVISELKTAFLMGFKLYLPFLIIDMVVASILISMGMLMLPPVLISLPFKLLLFVLVDGWHLVVAGLLASFRVT